jgi:hypothetical protein
LLSFAKGKILEVPVGAGRGIGCHANRKILQIVKDAGLKIKMYERKLFGIMYLLWAQPKK